MNYHFKVANDNGNAEHNIIINGEEFRDLNVFARVYNLKGYDDMLPGYVLQNIMDNLLVSITSPSCRTGTYLVGTSAINSSLRINEFKVGFDQKHSSDIPVISTLAKIAAYAVKKRHSEIGDEIFNEATDIDVAVEMATSLPIGEFYENENNKNIFKERFLNGPHTVLVHLGKNRIRVTIEFLKVSVTPEAAPVFWFLHDTLQDKKIADTFLAEFKKEYNLSSVSVKELANSKTLHLDIGSGTTEYPIVKRSIDPSFIRGENLGIGHAIEKALPDFRIEVNLPNLKRLEFDRIIKDKNHIWYEKAMNAIEPYLMEQADEIIDVLNDEIRKARKDIDLIIVYGGGSILLKEYLYDAIKEAADSTGKAKLLYTPAKYAVSLNVLGLNAFVNSKTFEAIPASKHIPATQTEVASTVEEPKK